jgi:hypothetical protein
MAHMPGSDSPRRPPAPLTVAQLQQAFAALDGRLEGPLTRVVGGGTAMLLAHGIAVRTTDVDAYPTSGDLDGLAPHVHAVARELGLAPDWLNPHFETFAHVLPQDYAARLATVYSGQRLRVTALGAEDLLVMKCFAGREKDVGHARALLRRVKDPGVVDRRIEELMDRGVAGALDAADFLDDVREGR